MYNWSIGLIKSDMKKDIVVVISDDDEGYTVLIRKNLMRAGITDKILNFKDGQETLDFFFGNNNVEDAKSYVLLLDIRMPKVNGIEVLQKIKNDNKLKEIPVIMITTTDDPVEIELCGKLGCYDYLIKPINFENF